MGLEKDLPPGEQLLALFRPFLERLAASHLSPKTIQKHVDNIWALGGEFIRDLHNDPSLRKKPVDLVLRRMIEYGGPLLYHGGEDQQRSFDSTCRKRRRFLSEPARQRSPSPTNSPDEAKNERSVFVACAELKNFTGRNNFRQNQCVHKARSVFEGLVRKSLQQQHAICRKREKPRSQEQED